MGEAFDPRVLDPRLLALFDGYVHGRLTRRQFLDRAAGVVAAGTSAAAVLAILSPDYALARQVDPEDPAISVGYKQYPSPDGAGVMRGYLARPADTGHKLPGVVVIHENRGLNPYIEDVARRLAVAGYLGFAPDALTPFGGYPGNDDEGRELQSQRDGEEMAADFVAAVRYLKEHPDCTGKVGAVGFCFGGGMVLRLATELPGLDAAVAFYGRHPDAADAARIRAPLLIHHAELDERINAGWPEFETALRASDVDYREYSYPEANHGFHNDTTPRFDAEAAQLAWARTVEFFNRHLVS
jgi:carboxymethylenebutenolidase